MDLIVFHNGVYVYVQKETECSKYSTAESAADIKKMAECDEEFIYSPSQFFLAKGGKVHVSFYDWRRTLYGGRVIVKNCDHSVLSILIDGVEIGFLGLGTYNNSWYCYPPKWNSSIPYSTAASILNQIEQLGVDSFLDNYKKELTDQLSQIQSELSEIEGKYQMDKDGLSGLEKAKRYEYPNIILKLRSLLCCLSILLCTGITNLQYVQVYNEVLNIYFS